MTLAALASIGFTLFCNNAFWLRITGAMFPHRLDSLTMVLGAFLLVAALQFLMLAMLLNRWTAKPVLVLLIIGTAAATHFMSRYGVYLDKEMLRNVLATDRAEASDLLTPDLAVHFFWYAAIPLAIVSRVEVKRDRFRDVWWTIPVAAVIAILIAVIGLRLASNQLMPQFREHREIRYLITPGNYVAGLLRLASESAPVKGAALVPMGLDAKQVNKSAKPTILVLVVGETVRAQNWGLNGYARQTTPQLAQRNVINFSSVSSCGTSTEVSLPCMFSAFGRHQYDEERIRHSESLLHVLKRAGVDVFWLDNQSGCKGVCQGLPAISLRELLPEACGEGNCLDEVLLDGLRKKLQQADRDQVIVLHQMGNHGPAYFQRYPAAFRRYQPDCATNELWKCTDPQIVNAYDNAILYTDDFLAKVIDLLQETSGTHASAMLYVSDHGESLGEDGMYLHGLPRTIAPETQTKVPMVLWLSPSDSAGKRIKFPCLQSRRAQELSHDNLFHSVLGLYGVSTALYQKDLDIFSDCSAS